MCNDSQQKRELKVKNVACTVLFDIYSENPKGSTQLNPPSILTHL